MEKILSGLEGEGNFISNPPEVYIEKAYSGMKISPKAYNNKVYSDINISPKHTLIWKFSYHHLKY